MLKVYVCMYVLSSAAAVLHQFCTFPYATDYALIRLVIFNSLSVRAGHSK